MDEDDYFSDALSILDIDLEPEPEPEQVEKRIYESVRCDICKCTIKHQTNFPAHLLSKKHIRKMYKQLYIEPLPIETTKESDSKKRKLPEELPEEYSKALNLFKSLKLKNTNPAMMG